MEIKLIVSMMLIIIATSHLSKQIGVPHDVAQKLNSNFQNAFSLLSNYGKGPTSLALLKHYFEEIDSCIGSITADFKKQTEQRGIKVGAQDNFLIASKELDELTKDSESIDLKFLISTTFSGTSKYMFIGAFKVNLVNLDDLLSSPDDVLSKQECASVFQAAKSLYLGTPDSMKILC